MKSKKGSKQPGNAKAARTNVVVPFAKHLVCASSKHSSVTASWVRFRFRNSYVCSLPVVNRDIDRVWRQVQDLGGFNTYVVFDTTTRRMAINLRYLSAVQFDAQSGEGVIAEGVPQSKTVDVMFVNIAEWLHIEVESDRLSISDIDNNGKGSNMDEADLEQSIQCANLLLTCDSSYEGSDYIERLRDVRASTIWLRLNDLAVVSTPFDFVLQNE